MKEFNEFVETIKKLRSPEGCPWDREQTMESLKPYLLEESYEVIDAMEKGGEELKGELGDLLLQIVFQSIIAEEKKEFTIKDVVEKINEKMIRRHPHVFQDKNIAKNTEEVLVNWEKIKKEEKEHKDRKSILDGIPKSFPALLRAEKLQKKASKVGFDWKKVDDVKEKVVEEIEEFLMELEKNSREKMEEELGDLMFSLVNLARHLKINPEICLNKASDKFEKRFKYVEEKCDFSKKVEIDEMEKYWNEAKKGE